MMDKYYLTKERLEELQSELEELKTKKRIEVSERLKTAKEFGDLSENSEYTEARDEQERIERRIFELDDLLKRVVIIKKSEGVDKVSVGSMVTVKKDGKAFVYHIVGSNETKPEEGKISNESPLGRAFLEHKVGDSVKVVTPKGEATYQITKVE
ncbi:MAG: transcription elongation factor GreA [Patescibacteria group bacterium]